MEKAYGEGLSTDEYGVSEAVWRPRGVLDSRVQTAYIVEILCPKISEMCISPRKLSAFEVVPISWTE
jgi:hypothetical protein